MTDYIYKLPVKLVSKNGRKYSEQILKSIRKQLKAKKLIGTTGEYTIEDLAHAATNKHFIINHKESNILYKEIDDENNLVFSSSIELPINYKDMCELAPMYLLEGNKVTLLSVNLVTKPCQPLITNHNVG